nr:unnamed protein product [Callosobruchus analis]
MLLERIYLEEVCHSMEDLAYANGKPVEVVEGKRRTRRAKEPELEEKLRCSTPLPEECVMTRYCAVCGVPYNSVEDHIQSRKHQKLIGEDANYIALNGSLNGFLHTNTIPFLNLNGIDAIGVHETSLDDLPPPLVPPPSSNGRRGAMRRTRAASMMHERPTRACTTQPRSPPPSAEVTPLPPNSHHHLRSRRTVNYAVDEDSLHEDEGKEFRSAMTASTPTATVSTTAPTTTAIATRGFTKRARSEEKQSTNQKTYYKVEVLTSRQRSLKEQQSTKRQQSQSPKREKDDEKDKGLIVKFKKLRNSELIRLNNEATNFLFPKKEESSSDEEEDQNGDDGSVINIESSTEESVLSCHELDSNGKIKTEDDASMDSTASSATKKKRRRTQAEAFILDNQKYYKFETPGSRLRYHGSYLPTIVKSPNHGGADKQCDSTDSTGEKRIPREHKVKVDNYKFSFEREPYNNAVMAAFKRQDTGRQKYTYFTFWDPFIMPYQMPYITPLDPRACRAYYREVLRYLQEPASAPEAEEAAESSNALTDCSASVASSGDVVGLHDEDSKMSMATTLSSAESAPEEDAAGATTTTAGVKGKKKKRTNAELLQSFTVGKNPRKSPRQHASTLAILSSFLQQRKRRPRNIEIDVPSAPLPTIAEETPKEAEVPKETAPAAQSQEVSALSPQNDSQSSPVTNKSPHRMPRRQAKAKIDYFSIAQSIDDELDTALKDENLAMLEADLERLGRMQEEEKDEFAVDFHACRINVSEIMQLYEEEKKKETVRSCRRFFTNNQPRMAPGRKPGKKRRMNLTEIDYEGTVEELAYRICLFLNGLEDAYEEDEELDETEDEEEARSTQTGYVNGEEIEEKFERMNLPRRDAFALIFCGTHDMPLRGKQADEGVLLDLLKLRIDSGDNKLKSHFEKCRRNAIYTSPRIQNELINLCGEVIQENVISEVRKTMAYSILADETADVSGKEQLSIGVRFYDESKSKIREEFVGFVELKAQNASAIAEAIDNFLISSNLSKEDCVGFGFDGCSTMAGKEGGVQAILRKKYPRALYFHCSSHKLNLVVNDANAVPEIRNTVATVKDVITFFRESTTRRNYAPNLSRLCETRWSEKYKSIRKFSQHFSELVKSLETLSVEGNYATRKSAYQLHSAVTKPVFIVSLQTIAKYSAVIEPVVNALQAKSIDMISVGKHIKNIKDILRNDREFPDRISNEILQKARAVAMDLNIEISVPRLAHKQTHRSNPPSDNDNEYWRRSLIIPYIDSLISSLNIRFSQENTPAFALSRLHPLYMTKTSIADLHKNAESFQEFYNLDITGELNLWHNLWVTKALSDDQLKDIEVVDLFKEANIFYPAVRKALIILSTIPCTTATVERSFSTLRRVKTSNKRGKDKDDNSTADSASVKDSSEDERMITAAQPTVTALKPLQTAKQKTTKVNHRSNKVTHCTPQTSLSKNKLTNGGTANIPELQPYVFVHKLDGSKVSVSCYLLELLNNY